MPNSVLDAIKMGVWNYEPNEVDDITFHATQAMPGSIEKLTVMAQRLQQGLPLWHPGDRRTYEE